MSAQQSPGASPTETSPCASPTPVSAPTRRLSQQAQHRRWEIKSAMRQAAMEFESANVELDGYLDEKQFGEMLKARTGNPELQQEYIRDWFQLLTTDNDKLTLHEFFCFCAYDVSHQVGGLGVIFASYDRDGSRFLDREEFAEAIEELGFEPATSALLSHFDLDGSGQLSYIEIFERILDDYADASYKELSNAIRRKSTNTERSFARLVRYDTYVV